MLVPYIRSSSYGNWDFCQMQYYIIYVLGFQNKTLLKAELGTATHKVMEVLGVCKKALQDGDARKSHTINDDAIGDVTFTQKSLNTDEFVDEIIQRSYDWYMSQSENDWVDNNLRVSVDGKSITDTFQFVKTLAYKGLNDWKGVCDPRTRNILDMEPHFDLPIEEDWAHFEYEKNGEKVKGQLAIKGTIDMVTQPKDDTIEVIDWKTGERKNFATSEEKDYAALCKDPQLLLYNHALSRLYPDVPNRIMTINFLRSGGPFSMAFDDDDDAMFIGMLKRRFTEITNAKRVYPVSQSRNNWKCKYTCAFSKPDPETGEMICKKVENEIKVHGIDGATANLRKNSFDPSFYSAPG